MGASCALTVTFTPNGEDARDGASLNFSSSGTNGPTHSIELAGTGGANAVTRVISANAVDVNMATLFGNPTVPANYVLTINAGVQVTASSTASPALTTGVFPAGSTVKIVNNGYIIGRGGNGGVGATVPYNNGSDVNYWGAAGAPGGPALDLKVAAAVDNSNGYVYGGGGGGGGGAGYIRWNKYAILAGGGGGGGGAGGGAGASGGSAVNLGDGGGTTNGGTGVSGGAAGGAGGFGGGQDQGLADVGDLAELAAVMGLPGRLAYPLITLVEAGLS